MTCLAKLCAKPASFDQLALGWLKGLDFTLHNMNPGLWRGSYPGFDGPSWLLRPRNNFIAETQSNDLRAVTWAAQQGHSMAAYAPHVLLHPAVDIVPPTRPAVAWRLLKQRNVRSRLRQAREDLRVMMWPLASLIDFPGLEEAVRNRDPFVHVRSPSNEEDLRAEVIQAIREAKRRRVTVLVFPELAITPTVADAARDALARDYEKDGAASFPVLTCMGLCHEQEKDGVLDLNEAIVLGPDGGEIHRHRKLVPFTVDRGHPIGERIRTGTEITVYETPIGNLAVLICLDLFHDQTQAPLRGCGANLLLVPSLSPTTSAHRGAAQALGGAQLVSTFVANRWLLPEPEIEERSTFFRVAGETRLDGPEPFLLFELS